MSGDGLMLWHIDRGSKYESQALHTMDLSISVRVRVGMVLVIL